MSSKYCKACALKVMETLLMCPSCGHKHFSTAPPTLQPTNVEKQLVNAPHLTDNSLSVEAAASTPSWLTKPYTPWRRYAARMLDTSLNGTIVFFLFGIAFYAIAPAAADDFFSVFETDNGAVLDIIATGVAASLLGGLLVGVSGFTLGKWIFGIKVTKPDETRLGIGEGVSRDFNVLLYGLGLGIPLISFFTMWSAYKKLSEGKPATWDGKKYVVWHRPSGTAQYILNVVGVLLIILNLVVLSVLGVL
jgi:uncharacterized RDD family membrane protein YckC